jgi:DNA-binding transcriptional ArsR family regulator
MSSLGGKKKDDTLDAVFGALSDRTRRKILARLMKGPASVTEIAEPLPMSLPAVSKHLVILERAGLLRRERDGRFHHLHLEAKPLETARELLDRYRAFWEGTLDELARYVEEEKEKNR